MYKIELKDRFMKIIVLAELKTLERWITRSMLDLLVLLNLKLG